MKKKTVLIQLIVFSLIIGLSGCTEVPSDDQTDNIPEGLYVDDDGKQEYSIIQDAIDAAPDNYTVYVFSGTYHETLLVNKTITLMGENPETTIIDGNKSGNVLTVSSAEKCNISGFTIQNSKSNSAGINLETSNNNVSNLIIKNNYNGLYAAGVKYNSLHNNSFISNSNYGIYFSGSNYNTIKYNAFTENGYGLRIKGSRYNIVFENQFENNSRGMYFCCGASNNVAYHNNFINNSIWNGNDYVGGNDWYDKDINEGNYWDDYQGTDDDDDGIGDTPYNITSDGTKQDLYPLINPLSFN